MRCENETKESKITLTGDSKKEGKPKGITQVIVTKPKVIQAPPIKAPPITPTTSTVEPPPNFPPPQPLPHLNLQTLLHKADVKKPLPKQPKLSAPPPKAAPPAESFPFPKSMAKNPFNCTKAEKFMEKARIPNFNQSKAPKMFYQQDCNDDLNLGSFIQSKTIWAGLQRKGVSPLITDPQNYIDHILKATRAIFPLSADIPIPQEIQDSLEFIMHGDPGAVVKFWDDQLMRLQSLTREAQPLQERWNDLIPPEIRGAQKKFKSVAFHQLLCHLSLGGDRWISQFIFGFPTTGVLSQEGIFPPSDMPKGPAPISSIWKTSVRRFKERARASGFKNAQVLWDEALSQVKEGWLSDPFEFDNEGNISQFPLGETNAAFRFGVSQGSKLRACDDLRHNLVNVCTAVLTPITLPTWDHLAQMSKAVFPSAKDWAFIKGDHASAYKQLPLDPKFANLTVVALRDPSSGRWMGFIPKVLLFGAVSAVLHYNSFSRALGVLVNRYLGIPLCTYYDDFGAYSPSIIKDHALRAFSNFSEILGADLNPDKSKAKDSLKFLGLKGDFPHIESGMLLRIYLPRSKISAWSELISETISKGFIDHKPLESLIGKLSFTQTSIFGRFGRTLLRFLQTKLHRHPYVKKLSEEEIDILKWRVASLGASIPRVVEPKSSRPEVLIYTDAATSTRIVAAVVLDVNEFLNLGEFQAVFKEISSTSWESTFKDTTYIYGLEMLAVIATIYLLGEFLRNKNVVIYVDNTNTKDALVKGFSPTRVINRMIQIFWASIQRNGIWVWIEHVGSTKNISDLPTRGVELPLKSQVEREFGILEKLREIIEQECPKESFFMNTLQ